MWQQKITAIYESIYHTDNLPSWLKQTTWQKVELHKKSKLCRVFYAGERALEPEQLQVAEGLFQALFPPGIRVELLWSGFVSPSQSIEAVQTPCNREQALEWALDCFYEKQPKGKLWLLSCEYDWVEEAHLQISFPSQAARDICEKLGAASFLRDRLSRYLGTDCRVGLLYEAELRQSIMAAAEQREEKIIASSLTAQKVCRGYSGLIYGKYIHEAPVPIGTVFAREEFCVVRGEIITVTESRLKSGKTVYLLTIYDDTGYLPVKISAGKEKDFYPEYLVPGQWIKCRGKYGMDRFSAEVVFSAFSAEGITHPVWGSDLADEKRTELCLHTKGSSFYSVIPVEQGVYTAARWGQPGIGVADRHSVAAFPRLAKDCKDYGLKAVYGMELVVLEDGNQLGVLTLWAKDKIGLVLLYRLLGAALRHEPGEVDGIAFAEFSQRLTEEDVRNHVLVGIDWTACSPTRWQSHWQGIIDYIIVTPIEGKDRQQEQKALLLWAEEQQISVIGTDGATCYSEKQAEIVSFAQEHGTGSEERPVCKILSTDSLCKAFDYLGTERAKKIVVRETESLLGRVEGIALVEGESLGYPENETFLQTVLSCAAKRYDGVIPEEISARLKEERTILEKNGYYWLYPALLKIKETYGGIFLQDNLLTSYVLGLSRENPLTAFVHCSHCGFSGGACGFSCPNCGDRVQEFGIGTCAEMEQSRQQLHKITLCGALELQPLIWQALSSFLGQSSLIAPGVYRQLSWEGTEAMAEIFLAGKNREELPGERQWYAAVCTGMLLGVEREDNTRFLLPPGESLNQLTPVLEADGELYTYFPKDVLQEHLLSVHYEQEGNGKLFWDIYRHLPAHGQSACMQARDWSAEGVWTLLKNCHLQGIPYLEQLPNNREISSVDDFVRAVADGIGMVLCEDGVASRTMAKEVSLQSIEGLFRHFGREIGFVWDICWLKAHFREVFYAVALNTLGDRSTFRDMWLERIPLGGRLGQLIGEMKEQSVTVLPIDVNVSQPMEFTPTAKGILSSLDSTSAFDSALIRSIEGCRQQEKFSSQKEFFQRLNISAHLQHLFLTEQLLEQLPEESQTSIF